MHRKSPLPTSSLMSGRLAANSLSAVGVVRKVDDYERLITMQDGTKIPMDDVLSIDGELFSTLE